VKKRLLGVRVVCWENADEPRATTKSVTYIGTSNMGDERQEETEDEVNGLMAFIMFFEDCLYEAIGPE